MDLVYICGPGDNEELRYSIRSAVKNLPHDNVWVVGDKPDWYIGPCIMVDQSKTKYTNAKNNLEAICNSDAISDSFVLMNDDFYIINKIDSVMPMHGGLLRDKINRYRDTLGQNSYISMLSETLKYISRRGKKDILDYELHIPMVMERSKLANVLENNVLWRSAYGNIFDIGGGKMDDVKVYGSGVRSSISYSIDDLRYDFLSSNDDSFEEIKNRILLNRFSHKTKYEK